MLSQGCSCDPKLELGVLLPCSAPQKLQCPQTGPPSECWDVFAIRHCGVPSWVSRCPALYVTDTDIIDVFMYMFRSPRVSRL